jgi:hypothetical protein
MKNKKTKQKKIWPLLMGVLVCWLGMSTMGYAQTVRYVDANHTLALDAGDCSNPLSPCKTLPYALGIVAAASGPNDIQIAPGTYGGGDVNGEVKLSFIATASSNTFILTSTLVIKNNSTTVQGVSSILGKSRLIAVNDTLRAAVLYSKVGTNGYDKSNVMNLIFEGFAKGAVIQDYPDPQWDYTPLPMNPAIPPYPHNQGSIGLQASNYGLRIQNADFTNCGYLGNKRIISMANNTGLLEISGSTFSNTSAYPIKYAIYHKGGLSGGNDAGTDFSASPANLRSKLDVNNCSFGSPTLPLWFDESLVDTLASIYVQKLTKVLFTNPASYNTQSFIRNSIFHSANVSNFATTKYSDIFMKDMRGYDLVVNGNTHYQLGNQGNVFSNGDVQYTMMNIPEGSGSFADIDMQGPLVLYANGSIWSYCTEITVNCFPGPYSDNSLGLINNFAIHSSTARIISIGVALPIAFPSFKLRESSDGEYVEIILDRPMPGIWAEWMEIPSTWKRAEGWRIPKGDIQTSTIYVRLVGIERGNLGYSQSKALHIDELGLKTWFDASDLILSVKQQIQAQIQVLSYDGKMVFSRSSVLLAAGENRFPLPGSPGVYIVRILVNGRFRSFKLMR